jgi:signal transduction histidine kinase
MFFRAGNLQTGSGLGLFSVKNSVVKLEGDISFFSEENVGTTFIIYLENSINK